jgi:hypothetical protein
VAPPLLLDEVLRVVKIFRETVEDDAADADVCDSFSRAVGAGAWAFSSSETDTGDAAASIGYDGESATMVAGDGASSRSSSSCGGCHEMVVLPLRELLASSGHASWMRAGRPVVVAAPAVARASALSREVSTMVDREVEFGVGIFSAASLVVRICVCMYRGAG